MNSQYIESDNSYHRPSRDNSSGTVVIVGVITMLFVILTAVLAFMFVKDRNEKAAAATSESVEINTELIAVSTPVPTEVPPIQDYQNPLLYPATASMTGTVDATAIVAEELPSYRGLTESVLVDGTVTTGYTRETPIDFGNSLDYSLVAGITTYRGNNFRNTASFGYTNVVDGTLTQVWEYSDLGTRLASTQNFEWSGLSLTGQPLIVRWDDSVKYCMNIYPEKVYKENLTEVIVASLDGYLHFFDLDDGSQTRDPYYLGFSVKGTAALDPRGYPLIYIGQGDDNSDDGNFGIYVYSLIDGSRLYSYTAMDDGAYRTNWNAADSSPVVDRQTDELVWPSENGIIYTFKLNTNWNPTEGTISVDPTVVGYRYIYNDDSSNKMGVESSAAIYNGYAYFVDNSANLNCLDLNTMSMIWTLKLGDDSDISPVIEEENGVPMVYVGTEVDWQNGTGEYSGAAYTYKVNGLTGEVVWQTSQSCYTYNADSSDSDQNGGCVGNPIIGKKSISNLVIFSYSMTNGLASGNRLVAYDKQLGTVVWTYDMNIYSYSSPVDCYDEDGNAYIVIGDSLGQIHLINALDGSRITYIQASRLIGTDSETTDGVVFEASPVIYGDMMVIGTKSGSLFGIRIS